MPQLTQQQIERALQRGVSEEDITSFILTGKVQPKTKTTFKAEVGEPVKEPLRLLGNIPRSAFETVKGFVSGIAKIPGTILKQIPEQFTGLREEVGGVPEAIKATAKEAPKELLKIIPEFARKLVKGETEEAEKILVEDPVGQILPFLIAGRGAAATAGKTAQFDAAISGLARPAISATKTIATAGAKGLGKVATAGGGVLTGTGRIPLQEAFKAGRETGGVGVFKPTPFSQALRGKTEPNAIVKNATDAVEFLKNKRGDTYRVQLKEVAKQKESIDISNVFETYENALKKFNIKVDKQGKADFSRSTIGRADAVNDVRGVVELMRDWGKRHGDRTPISMDILKRKLDDFYSDSSQARTFVGEIKSSVKSTLDKQVPGYKKMTSSYQEASQLLDDMKQGLALGGKAGADTILKRLTSAIKQDNALRTQLLNELEIQSGIELTQGITGAFLSQFPARGLVGRGIQATAGFSVIAGMLNPNVLFSLLFTSPRIVGEFLQALGASATQAQRLLNAMNELRPILSPGKQTGTQTLKK